MKSIKITAFILFSITTFSSFSQDTIVLHNNDKILCKIIEISSIDVKFKKFENIDGPDYLESKSNIHQILFNSGLVETFEKEVKQEIIVKKELPKYNEKIDLIGNKFYYKGNEYRYKEIKTDVLQKSTNKKLQELIQKKTTNDVIYYSTFIGVPTVIVGASFIAIGTVDQIFGGNGDITTTGLIITSGGVLTLSFNSFCKGRDKYLKKRIIQVYNEGL